MCSECGTDRSIWQARQEKYDSSFLICQRCARKINSETLPGECGKMMNYTNKQAKWEYQEFNKCNDLTV